MKASIISIGDEILIGKTINTNAAFIGDKLELLGIEVHEVITVHDEGDAIKSAIERAFISSEITIMTGGLGPTKDDITKQVLADFFGADLVRSQEQLDHIRSYFESRGRILNELNESVADIPSNAQLLHNPKGTAAGMWFKEAGRILVSMPGVPNEMRHMVEFEVIPRLTEEFDIPTIIHRHLLTAGIGESTIAEMIGDLEDDLPDYIKLAYLPSIGQVKLRLSARGDNMSFLADEIDKLEVLFKERIGKYYFGKDGDTLQSVVGDLLNEKNETLATAESCTGGNIAHLLTSTPGSSSYFMGSVVAYDNRIKEEILKVPAETLKEHGAVSEATIESMVRGVIDLLDVDFAIASSGIAGPGGGTEEKPVGTVWVAVGNREKIHARKFHFPLGRLEHIEFTSITGLEMLRRFILRERGQLE